MMDDDDDEMNRVATVRAESSFCNSAIHSIMQRSQKMSTIHVYDSDTQLHDI